MQITQLVKKAEENMYENNSKENCCNTVFDCFTAHGKSKKDKISSAKVLLFRKHETFVCH